MCSLTVSFYLKNRRVNKILQSLPLEFVSGQRMCVIFTKGLGGISSVKPLRNILFPVKFLPQPLHPTPTPLSMQVNAKHCVFPEYFVGWFHLCASNQMAAPLLGPDSLRCYTVISRQPPIVPWQQSAVKKRTPDFSLMFWGKVTWPRRERGTFGWA